MRAVTLTGDVDRARNILYRGTLVGHIIHVQPNKFIVYKNNEEIGTITVVKNKLTLTSKFKCRGGYTMLESAIESLWIALP